MIEFKEIEYFDHTGSRFDYSRAAYQTRSPSSRNTSRNLHVLIQFGIGLTQEQLMLLTADYALQFDFLLPVIMGR